MAQNETTDRNSATRQEPQDAASVPKKKQTRPLLTIFLVFFAFVTVVLITQRKDTIDWTEDYEAGLQAAKQQNKPVLLAFYKQFGGFSTYAWQNTYTNDEVIEYVEANFIPILIDVYKQPEIAERYKISYYPTHYVKPSDSNDLFGPMMGYDPPALFIEKLEALLDQMNSAGK